jgi:hypothetical protein
MKQNTDENNGFSATISLPELGMCLSDSTLQFGMMFSFCP